MDFSGLPESKTLHVVTQASSYKRIMQLSDEIIHEDYEGELESGRNSKVISMPISMHITNQDVERTEGSHPASHSSGQIGPD